MPVAIPYRFCQQAELKKESKLAMKILVRLLSGDGLAELEVAHDMSVGHLKQEIKKLQPCEDEVKRRLSQVDVVFGHQKLWNNDASLVEAGLSPDSEVYVMFWETEPVLCAHQLEAPCQPDQLIAVRIPNRVRTIPAGAFQKCRSLVKVIIPDSVVAIGNSAFRDCSSLVDLIIPESVRVINHAVFNNCRSLRTLTIPDGVHQIGSWAFKGCRSLTLTLSSAQAGLLSGFNDCAILTNNCQCYQCAVEWFQYGWVCPAQWHAHRRR